MASAPVPSDPGGDARLQNRFRRAGIGILIAGLCAAIVVLLATNVAAGGPADASAADNSKVYEQNLEHIGGKSAVLGVEMGDWWSSLWHGRRLALTLATVAGVSAGGCFFAAYLLGLPPRD